MTWEEQRKVLKEMGYNKLHGLPQPLALVVFRGASVPNSDYPTAG